MFDFSKPIIRREAIGETYTWQLPRQQKPRLLGNAVHIMPDTEYTDLYPELPQRGIYTERQVDPWKDERKNTISTFQYIAVGPDGKAVARLIRPDMYDDRERKRPMLRNIVFDAYRQLGLTLRGHENVWFIWHGGCAELGVCRDGAKFYQDHQKELLLDGLAAYTLDTPIKVTWHDPQRNKKAYKIRFVDTMKLVNDRTSLHELGKMFGLPKLSMGEWIKNMEEAWDAVRDQFIAYAMRDCEVPWHAICRMAEDQARILKLDRFKSTLSMAAASGLLKHYGGMAMHKERFDMEFMEKSKVYRPRHRRGASESIATQAFHGASNQSYVIGTVHGPVLDADLQGAYTAIMASVPQPDWAKAPEHPKTPEEVAAYPIGFAVVTAFEFPAGEMFPCLPVDAGNGIIYPRSWQTPLTFTSIEIAEALRLGCRMEIYESTCLPTVPEEWLVADYMRTLAQMRKEAERCNDIPAAFAAKTSALSIFGKAAQGITDRIPDESLFRYGHMDSRQKEYSSVTMPHFAATITGVCRAALSVMVREANRCAGEVLSATTDGFMWLLPEGAPLAFPAGFLEACEAHPAIQQIMLGRQNIGEDPHGWLQIKHKGLEATTIKTRLNEIKGYVDPDEPTKDWSYKAATGFSRTTPFAEIKHHYEQRTEGFYVDTHITNIREVANGEAADIVNTIICSELNLRPDWKRVVSAMPDERGVYRTRPFDSKDEYLAYRRTIDKQKTKAWPETVVPDTDAKLEQPKRQDIMRLIATNTPGFRLPEGRSLASVAPYFKVNRSTLYRLKDEKPKAENFNLNTQYTQAVQTELQLW